MKILTNHKLTLCIISFVLMLSPCAAAEIQKSQVKKPIDLGDKTRAWLKWGRQLDSTLQTRFRTFAILAKSSKQCQISYKVDRRLTIRDIKIVESFDDKRLDVLAIKIVQSLNGNPILKFPSDIANKPKSIERTIIFSVPRTVDGLH